MATKSLVPAVVAVVALGYVSVVAFVPKSLHLQRPSPGLHPANINTKVSSATTLTAPTTIPEVFRGVSLPPGQKPPEVLNEFTQEKGAAFEELAPANFLLVGQPKTSLEVPTNALKEVNNLEANVPSPETYKFFGNGKHEKSLELLLKSNPFFASALTKTWYGYKLKSYDPNDKDPSLFLQIMRTFNGAGHRVNFEFYRNMRIKSFTVYDDIEGKRIRNPLDMNKYASSALYNVIFYSSCIHATIHVFHYLMTAAFQEASKDFPEMNQWATSYARNVATKYAQVGQVLIKDPPQFGTLDTAIITGADGFGSSQAVRPILKNLLDTWGQNPTAEGWLEKMTGMSYSTMVDQKILKEFNKHFELIKPFAAETSGALREINPDKYAVAQDKLKTYLQSCGTFKSDIETLEQWIELMSITGAVHGATLSYTRMIGDVDIARWRNIQSETWDFADINLITAGLGTIVGMQPGRHVMAKKTNTGDNYTPALQEVLDKYNQKTTDLKAKYKKELLEFGGFDEYGWILSDYCPDDFDGKQLTITTYI